MNTLDNLFNHFGLPSDEMNLTKHYYFTRADKIRSLERVKEEDNRTVDTICELLEFADLLKEYRETLYNRAQEFLTAGYSMQLKIKREIDCWRANKKFYVVEVLKIIDLPNAEPVQILKETFEGKERHTALKRFEQLKKLYPNIEIIKDIEKRKWEK